MPLLWNEIFLLNKKSSIKISDFVYGKQTVESISGPTDGLVFSVASGENNCKTENNSLRLNDITKFVELQEASYLENANLGQLLT